MKVTQVYSILNSLARDVLGTAQYLDSSGSAYDGSGNQYVIYPDGNNNKVYAVDPTTGEVTTNATTITGNFTPSWFVAADLSNVVDIGRMITSSDQFTEGSLDTIYKSLINHIGKVVFVDRIYRPLIPSLERSNWEYGSVVEKIDCDMPDTTYNVEWQLIDKAIYEQDRFHAPKNIRAKFFNDGVTFEIEMSFTEEQLKQSFSSANQLNSFFSMIATKISNTMTINFANLSRATINSMIAATLYRDLSVYLSSGVYTGLNAPKTVGGVTYYPTTVRCVNLLYSYYQEVPTAPVDEDENPILTAQNCLKDAEFIRYAVYKMALVSNRMADLSTLFNIGGKQRFTPQDLQHFVLLSEFAKAADVYLQSDTFHQEYTKMPKYEEINYWQGTGSDYSFANTSKISCKANVTSNGSSYSKELSEITGVIGVIFDNDAMGINNEKQKTTSHYNAKGDFINNYYKAFARYYNDHDENCVVFYVA